MAKNGAEGMGEMGGHRDEIPIFPRLQIFPLVPFAKLGTSSRMENWGKLKIAVVIGKFRYQGGRLAVGVLAVHSSRLLVVW